MPVRKALSAEERTRVQTWLIALIALVIAGWALRAMAIVLVPVVCAVFLALLIAPLDRRVAESAPGRLRWLGHVAAMGVVLLVLAIFFGSIWIAAQRVAEQVPQSLGTGLLSGESAQDAGNGNGEGTALERLSEEVVAQTGGGGSGGTRARIADAVLQAGGQLGSYATGFAESVLASAGTTLGALTLIFFLTLLMLVEAPRWRGKAGAILKDSEREAWLGSIGLIAEKVRRYLLARTILGLLTAALYVGWLWIFGVELLIVWGLLTFLLNYIPTLGSLISGILPVLYAFLTKDFGTAILVGLGILVIEQVVGNYIDPRMQGRHVKISPFVVLVVLVVWGWLWGVAGAILAVPITIAIVVTCAQFPALRPVAILLSSEREAESLERSARGGA